MQFLFLLYRIEMAKGCQSYEILCCTMLLLFGFVIAHMLEDTKNKVWYLILIFAVAVWLRCFFVLFYQEPHYDILGKAAIGAAVTDLAAAFVYPFLIKQKEAEIDNFLTDITEEDYGLLRELKKFSRQEYRHALCVGNRRKMCIYCRGRCCCL